MAEIFQEENAIVLAAAEKMVALGSEAAQRSILGKESKTQEAKGEKILRLLTAYRKKDDLTDAQLESILYCLRQASESNVFPTIDPIVGQNLEYLVQEEGGGSSALIMQNAGSDLPNRSYLNFYRGLTASDDGTRTNVGMTLGTDGYWLRMDSGLPVWTELLLGDISDVTITTPTSGQVLKYNGTIWINDTDSAGHVIENAGTPLTQRANINISNGLTASDNTPDTDVKLGGSFIENTTILGGGLYSLNIDQLTGFNMNGGAVIISSDDNISLSADVNASYVASEDMLISGGTQININSPAIYIGDGVGTLGIDIRAGFTAGDNILSTISGTAYSVTGTFANFAGIEYGADYSADYSARSLIDKGYADGAYWSLASGGTLTGVNTLTSNTANQLNFTGTWTATANNQFMAQFGGTLTATTTASDILNGYVFNPSITGGATNAQTIRGVTIQPTLTGGADNGDFTAALYVNPIFSGTFGAKFGILSLASLSTVYAGLRVQNSSTGSARLEILAENSSGINAITSMFSIERANGTNGTVSITNTGGGAVNFYTAGSGTPLATFSDTRIGVDVKRLTIVQQGLAASWVEALKVTPGAHTSMTSSTEFLANDFSGASWQWIAGTIPIQRFNYFKAFTATGASSTNTITTAATVWIDQTTVGANAAITNNYALYVNGNQHVNLSSGQFFGVGSSAGFNPFQVDQNGKITVALPNQGASFGNANFMVFSGGAHTGQTASTENRDINWSGLARTVTWSTGNITTQRSVHIGGPTWAFAGSSTITNGYTLYVDGPTAGTNATITYNFAAGFNGRVIVTDDFFADDFIYLGHPTTAGISRYIICNGSSASVGLQIGTKGAGQLDISTPNNDTGNVVIYGHNIAIGGDTRSTAPGDIDIIGNDSSLSGAPGSHIFIRSGQGLVGNANSGNIYVYIGDKAGTGVQGNIGLLSNDTDFDGAEKVIRIGARVTAPSGTLVADHAYLYVEDITAGNAAVHLMTEAGDILKLYAAAGWGTPTNTLTRTTFDTSTVTLPQLAERVGALISDLKTLHGLLKA